MAAGPQLSTFSKLDAAGVPARLRVLLPPNLPVAAQRDAIAVRFEIAIAGKGNVSPDLVPRHLTLAVEPAHLSATFLVESWNSGKMPPFGLVTRAQLSALLAVLQDEPVFFFANRSLEAIAWREGKLAGVSEHLVVAPPAAAPAPGSPASPTAAGPVAPTREVSRVADAVQRVAARRSSDATPPLVDGSEHYLAIQLPSKEHFGYEEILELLKAEGFRLETSNRKWWQRDRHRTLNFLARFQAKFADHWGATFSDNFRKNTAHLRIAEVACDLQAAGDDFEVTLAVRAGGADEREIAQALTTGRTYVESAGKVYLFDAAQLGKLHEAQRALAGSTGVPLLGRSRHKIPRTRVAEADALLTAVSPNLQPPEEWRRRTEIFRDPAKLAPAPAPAEIDRLLRPYQRLGVAWLWHLRHASLGGILADEMGLGKTLQALALVAALRRTRPQSPPALVICPATLVENWRRESARFAPWLNVLVHHGDARADAEAPLRRADIVITSYGTLTRDQALLGAIEWDTLIADEAQHVKNRRTQNAQALQSLRAAGRILLTGTPVENSLGDLESLFAVILPGYMRGIPGDARGEDRTWHEARLRRQAAPYILRRTKAQVTPELPAKIEQVVYVEMTPAQRAFYESVRTATENELMRLEAAGQSEGRIRMAMFTQLLRLRQVCGDPRLIEPARDPAESAKLAALLEVLDEAADDGHRVLVFSQFTSLLALVRAELDARQTGYCYLDGAMPTKARQAEVDRFNAGGADLPVFLLSLKAGGTGLNLASADTVVHLDPWWNPAAEAQATDRAHRIGQTRVVTSYKLIAAGTVEERVLAMQNEKRALLAHVFDEADAANAALTLEDMRALVAR
jgi:superfamily II DNA or RNA helicase